MNRPLFAHDHANIRSVPMDGEGRAPENLAVLLPDPRLVGPGEVLEDLVRRDVPGPPVEELLVAIEVRGDDWRVGGGERTDVHASALSKTMFSASTCMPTDS